MQALQFRKKREAELLRDRAVRGPGKAVAVRDALRMGAVSGVHVVDELLRAGVVDSDVVSGPMVWNFTLTLTADRRYRAGPCCGRPCFRAQQGHRDVGGALPVEK